MNSDKISCPICSEEFSSAAIENHVSKCLFLNESASSKSSTCFKDGSPARKSVKLSDTKMKKINLGTVKRKSNVTESSSMDTDFQSPGISSNNDVIMFSYFVRQRIIVLEGMIMINNENF